MPELVRKRRASSCMGTEPRRGSLRVLRAVAPPPPVPWGACSHCPRRRRNAGGVTGVTGGTAGPPLGRQHVPLVGPCLLLWMSMLLLYFFPHCFLLCFKFPLKCLGFCLTQLMLDFLFNRNRLGQMPSRQLFKAFNPPPCPQLFTLTFSS